MAKSRAKAVSLEDQFKHVTYDMLVLAMALRYMNESWPKRFSNSMYGPKEVATVAALIKIRSLDYFLWGPYDADDIRVSDFVTAGCSGPRGDQPPDSFRKSVNKYVAHLTKERTVRDVPHPKAGHVLKYGKQILTSCEFFVDDCASGLKIRGRAAKYLAAFREEWAAVKAK